MGCADAVVVLLLRLLFLRYTAGRGRLDLKVLGWRVGFRSGAVIRGLGSVAAGARNGWTEFGEMEELLSLSVSWLSGRGCCVCGDDGNSAFIDLVPAELTRSGSSACSSGPSLKISLGPAGVGVAMVNPLNGSETSSMAFALMSKSEFVELVLLFSGDE